MSIDYNKVPDSVESITEKEKDIAYNLSRIAQCEANITMTERGLETTKAGLKALIRGGGRISEEGLIAITGTKVYVSTVTIEGWATVTGYVPGEIFPIVITLDVPDIDGHRFYRVCKDDIKEDE